MITSTPSNISKSNPDKPLGMLAKRPWLLVIAAFGLMFTAWGVLMYFATTNQPASVPLVTHH